MLRSEYVIGQVMSDLQALHSIHHTFMARRASTSAALQARVAPLSAPFAKTRETLNSLDFFREPAWFFVAARSFRARSFARLSQNPLSTGSTTTFFEEAQLDLL